MRRAIISIIIVYLLFSINYADEPVKLGPEWVKDRDGGMYRRKIQAEEARSSGGNVSNFHLSTAHGVVYATETDSGGIMKVAAKPKDGVPYAEIEVSKDKKGKIIELSATLRNEVIYIDFDADGMIDALIDNRAGGLDAVIILDGKFVQVEGQHRAFVRTKEQPPQAKSHDRKVNYIFKSGKWKVNEDKDK